MFTKYILALCLGLSVSVAKADLDITCYSGDCLGQGWDVFNPQEFWTNPVHCLGRDCRFIGWEDIQNHRQSSCLQNGCFREGWEEFDTETGRKVGHTNCLRGPIGFDCLSYGWLTMLPNGMRVQSQCIQGDCTRWGWQIRYPNGYIEQVRCKQGGCFQQGWTLLQ